VSAVFWSERGCRRRARLSPAAGRPGFYALFLMGTWTFLFSDVEGSTALLRRVGPGAHEQMLADHHALIRSALAAHGGREANALGDGFLAGFSSPQACVAAVLQVQQAVEAHAWPGGEQVGVRMSIHAGEASQTGAGLAGLEVRRATRVAAVAHGGQVLVSETAAVLVRDWLPPGAALTDLGVHRLNDLGRPERLFQLAAPGLRAEFPPLRSLGSAALPNNLPAQLASFIGRGRELAEVRALVESSRLVTLTGAGGCGKTRLGLQVAAELLDGSGDGVWLAELAAVGDQDAVAPAIAGALGIAGQAGRPAAEALLDALAPQDILIVLDNCEHLIDACAKIAELIVRRCPRVHLLATSREPLGIGGETVYRVPSLSLPGPDDNGSPAAESDAVALFIDRARTQGVSLAGDEQTSALVVSVCRRLDGMPLAIELAAARLRSLSLTSLHDRLDQRFRLLTGGSRTALERQQTLRATVDWSYSLLTGAERVLLRRLSVFPESFDLDAAEAVCGFGDLDALDVAGLLGSLADKSLAGAEPAGGTLRYRLLETIRQFAAERLAEAGQDEAAAAAAAHGARFLSVAEAAAPHLTGPDQGRWLARLDAEQANLRRAAEHAAGHPEGTARVLRFGVALRRYWMARHRDQEARALLIPALQRPDARADPRLFGAALVTAVFTTRAAAGAGTSRRLGDQAVEFARQLGDERLLVESLAASCEAYFFIGEPQAGRPLGQEAVEHARQLGDDVLLGESLMEYLLCSDLIDPADYRQLFAEAIACTRRSGDQLVSGILYNDAGVEALHDGDIPAARARLDAAAQAMQAIGEDSRILSLNLGWVLRQEGDPAAARSMFGAALRTARRNGDHAGLAYASLGLACLAADRGGWHQAGQLHGVAQAFLDRAGEPWEELEARYRREGLDDVRASLGDEQTDLAYAEGMALSVDEAHDLARAQLTAPDPRQPPQPPGLAQLSARERELVILVARGATDAQIAERLYISVSTVRSHLDRIRDKTGCRRRADLTRLALQARLI
jgi:predicted ATPase/class 3 adenylate cyclase/DNA-binding CsgD family transcriptional regulator